MNMKTRILALAMLALILTGCSTTRIKQPQLDPIDAPEPPVLLSRLPVEAMRECEDIPKPPAVSVLSPTEQGTTILNYVLTLYGGYADCSLRHQQLKGWIEDER